MTALTYESGAIVAGRYHLGARLGEGGFGAVYCAHDTRLQRDVALKILRREAFERPMALQRFYREIELARRLNHPNTVRLYEFGETELGVPFIAWELLRGRSLEEVLAREGALATERVAHIGAQVLKSLMEAHALGIVHRDIKPANVFLCAYAGEPDFVKVLDFGIATMEAPDARPLTSEGQTIGTPHYMAPEQVLASRIDARTDLYALGLVLAEALSGKRIYDDTVSLRICMAQASAEPVPLPEIVMRSRLAHVIHRATQKRPEARYRSAAEMLSDMDPSAVPHAPSYQPSAYASTAPGAPQTTPIQYTAPLAATPFTTGVPVVHAVAGPSRRALVLGAVGVLLLAGGGGLGLWLQRSLPSKRKGDLPKSPGKPPHKRNEALAGYEIEGVDAQKVLDRLAADGWSVGNEVQPSSENLVAVNYVVQNGTMGGAVMFHKWSSEDEAVIAENSYRGQGMAVVREDTRLFAVQLGDKKLSQQLLERLLR